MGRGMNIINIICIININISKNQRRHLLRNGQSNPISIDKTATAIAEKNGADVLEKFATMTKVTRPINEPITPRLFGV